ncbi:MAG: hypothetical protein WB562_04460 [Candidatus Sulfotelmatobacter sp.]
MPDSEKPDDSTLPRPELNPLLNPILASHMGRWAEVYFTNPPEKREEAILELLRELESNPGAESDPVPVAAEIMHADVPTAVANSAPQAAKPSSVCNLCGHKNASEQLFCGACGARLSMGATPVGAVSPREAYHPAPPAASAVVDAFDVVPTLRQIIEKSGDPYSPSPVPSLGPARREPVAPRAARTPGVVRVQPDPPPNRRPLYVGAGVVALLLAGLLYMGWRVNVKSSGAPIQGLQPSTPQPPAPAPQLPAPTLEDTQQHTKRPAVNRQPTATKPAAPNPAPLSSATAVTQEGGTDELARAQKYLNGAPGDNHDSSEAAKWLWKAVSKQNMTGTLLLSDLYLRGDGVPRSCDQARLLLSAAARKGNAEAGQRLRNLRAYGCQ